MLVDTSAGFFKSTDNRQGLADGIDLSAMRQAVGGPPPEPMFKAADGHAFPTQDVYDRVTFQGYIDTWVSNHTGGAPVTFTFQKTTAAHADSAGAELRRQLLGYKNVADVTFTGP